MHYHLNYYMKKKKLESDKIQKSIIFIKDLGECWNHLEKEFFFPSLF